MTKSQKQIGAQLERNAIRKKIRDMIKDKLLNPIISTDSILHVLLDWINNRHVRYNKQSGGLGRK